MSDFAIIYPLAAVTLIGGVAFGAHQVRRMRRLKGRTRPSALAEDGNPHEKQP